VLGSVLVDSSPTAVQARSEYETNLGTIGRLLRGSALYPCDKHPERMSCASGEATAGAPTRHGTRHVVS
jgi:hypothetical protein